MLTIDIAGAIDDYVKDLDSRMAAALTESAHYVADQMARRQRKLAPIRKTGGGSLRQSIHAEEPKADGWKVAAATSAGVHYAFYQEYGTGFKGDAQTFDGQPILHTDKKQWMYEDEQGVTRYGHPMEGRHFMRDGVDREAMARQMANKLVRRLNA